MKRVNWWACWWTAVLLILLLGCGKPTCYRTADWDPSDGRTWLFWHQIDPTNPSGICGEVEGHSDKDALSVVDIVLPGGTQQIVFSNAAEAIRFVEASCPSIPGPVKLREFPVQEWSH